jgi:hypothetical protein
MTAVGRFAFHGNRGLVRRGILNPVNTELKLVHPLVEVTELTFEP